MMSDVESIVILANDPRQHFGAFFVLDFFLFESFKDFRIVIDFPLFVMA
jgi:hypothetical protein